MKLVSGGVSPDLLHLFSPSGGKAPRAGQTGFPQHAQEANRLSAGPAGRGRGQEVCQVSLGEQQETHHQKKTIMDTSPLELTGEITFDWL